MQKGLPAEQLDIALVVLDAGPLVDERDGEIFSQMGGIARHEGRTDGENKLLL